MVEGKSAEVLATVRCERLGLNPELGIGIEKEKVIEKEKEGEKGLDPVPPLRGGSVFSDSEKSFKILCSEGRHYREFFLAVFLLRRTGAAVDEVDGAPR